MVFWRLSMKINEKASPYNPNEKEEARLAGGFGGKAAPQGPEALLRRSVMACLLWEDVAYENGISVAHTIRELIARVPAQKVFDLAVEARTKQKLRHVPLFIAREMARLPSHKGLVGKLLPLIIKRPDELSEFLAIYWKDGKQPLSKQVKTGLANAFQQFDAYQLAKWNKKNAIKLRDVLFLIHPHPGDKENLFKKLADNTLSLPDTWEAALSSGADKKETWTRLINEGKLGALAFLRNLRNMEKAGVEKGVILRGFKSLHPQWLLPFNYMAPAKWAPDWERAIEALMLRSLDTTRKLPGHTVFVVDVSGSMDCPVSRKSVFNRLDAAAAMAIIAMEKSELLTLYATSGSDYERTHKTVKLKPRRGFALCDEIRKAAGELGGGGIFTRQCLEYLEKVEPVRPDRIIIFSDSQDCDYPEKSMPRPFGVKNYIVDVSSHSRGIGFDGLWTAEISGWSEHFLDYIFACEGLSLEEAQ